MSNLNNLLDHFYNDKHQIIVHSQKINAISSSQNGLEICFVLNQKSFSLKKENLKGFQNFGSSNISIAANRTIQMSDSYLLFEAYNHYFSIFLSMTGCFISVYKCVEERKKKIGSENV